MVRQSIVRKTLRGKKAPICPECRSLAGVPILYGHLTAEQNKAVRKGLAVAADNEEWEGKTEWHCKGCGCDWSRGWQRFKKPR